MKDELDILKEVGTIAAGHSSVALSEILDKKIILDVPSAEIISAQRVPQSMTLEKLGIAVFFQLLVGLQGKVIFILDEKNAFRLIDLSYKIRDLKREPGIITEVSLSLIKEIGNIVVCAYLNALSLTLKRIIVPPLPTLLSGSLEDILQIVFSGYEEDYAYIIETSFKEPQESIQGFFYLILTPEAAKDIRESCKKLLEEIRRGQPPL
ncbi:MAG: chemotaxis protein CheC [Candidatus Omnitrophica bacterium]|nr:chemotaxis protein CheC [Candidatus Omnitrophota bacterium]